MSLYDYKQSQEINVNDYGFYALVMACIRKSDDINLEKFKTIFPDIVEEFKLRYNARGGEIEGDRI